MILHSRSLSAVRQISVHAAWSSSVVFIAQKNTAIARITVWQKDDQIRKSPQLILRGLS